MKSKSPHAKAWRARLHKQREQEMQAMAKKRREYRSY